MLGNHHLSKKKMAHQQLWAETILDSYMYNALLAKNRQNIPKWWG